MGGVEPLRKIVDDEVQEQKVVRPNKAKQPSHNNSLLLVRIAVAIILAMAVISYFLF